MSHIEKAIVVGVIGLVGLVGVGGYSLHAADQKRKEEAAAEQRRFERTLADAKERAARADAEAKAQMERLRAQSEEIERQKAAMSRYLSEADRDAQVRVQEANVQAQYAAAEERLREATSLTTAAAVSPYAQYLAQAQAARRPQQISAQPTPDPDAASRAASEQRARAEECVDRHLDNGYSYENARRLCD